MFQCLLLFVLHSLKLLFKDTFLFLANEEHYCIAFVLNLISCLAKFTFSTSLIKPIETSKLDRSLFTRTCHNIEKYLTYDKLQLSLYSTDHNSFGGGSISEAQLIKDYTQLVSSLWVCYACFSEREESLV